MLTNLSGDQAGGFLHGQAAEVGGAAGISPFIKGGEIGIGRVNNDVFYRDAQFFGGHLGQNGIRAGAQIGGADEHVERAVIVHFDGSGGHIQPCNGGAMDAHRQADAFAHLAGLMLVFFALLVKVSGLQANIDTFFKGRTEHGLGGAIAALPQIC